MWMRRQMCDKKSTQILCTLNQLLKNSCSLYKTFFFKEDEDFIYTLGKIIELP